MNQVLTHTHTRSNTHFAGEGSEYCERNLCINYLTKIFSRLSFSFYYFSENALKKWVRNKWDHHDFFSSAQRAHSFYAICVDGGNKHTHMRGREFKIFSNYTQVAADY
jgi:hypothetical protein